MTAELTAATDAFDFALARLASTSKKSGFEILRQQAKIVFTNVAKYTPPASANVTGRAAEKQGQAKVAADIRSLYGTPADAYSALAGVAPAQASAFWLLHSHGQDDRAAEIVRGTLKKSFVPFDGGALHQRTGGGVKRRRREKREHAFYIRNPHSMEVYIQQEQSHVWWLASGWAPALSALGIALPYGVSKFSAAPGNLKTVIRDDFISLTMADLVKYGPLIPGIHRRLAWALRIQTEKLDRKWNHYIKDAAEAAGFRVS